MVVNMWYVAILVGLILVFWVIPWIKRILDNSKIANSVRDMNIKQIKRTIKQLSIKREELFDEE